MGFPTFGLLLYPNQALSGSETSSAAATPSRAAGTDFGFLVCEFSNNALVLLYRSPQVSVKACGVQKSEKTPIRLSLLS